MLPVDMTCKRLCVATDELLACVGEALLVSERTREAAMAGDVARINALAAETARIAEGIKAAGRELLACAHTGGAGPCDTREDILQYMARVDSLYGTDLMDKIARLAETARALAVTQAANVSLLSAMGREIERLASFLMNFLGGWVIYGDDGTAVTGSNDPYRLSFSA